MRGGGMFDGSWKCKINPFRDYVVYKINVNSNLKQNIQF